MDEELGPWTPLPNVRPEPQRPDPSIAADPFWGTLGLGADSEGASAPMSGWYPASAPKRKRLGRWLQRRRNAPWWPLVTVLALCVGVAIGVPLAHISSGPDATPPAKVYGDCHLEVYDTDKADSGTWTKVTTPGYDCPPMQVWPTVLVNR